MMIDRYTKSVLTVIAGCLLWICARDVRVVPPAYGQRGPDSPQRVEIIGIRQPAHPNDRGGNPRPFAWDPIIVGR